MLDFLCYLSLASYNRHKKFTTSIYKYQQPNTHYQLSAFTPALLLVLWLFSAARAELTPSAFFLEDDGIVSCVGSWELSRGEAGGREG